MCDPAAGNATLTLHNGRSVVVRINDRLYYKMKRVVDLSKAAARSLHHTDGLIRVKVEVLGRKKPVLNLVGKTGY